MEKKETKTKTKEKKIIKKVFDKKNMLKVVTKLLGLLIFVWAILISSLVFLLVKYSDEVSLSIDELKNGTEETTTSELVVTEEEKNVIEIVKENEESVVSIAVSQLSFSQTEGIVDEDSNIGTGFVVKENGIIVTNQHVVSDTTESYKVVTNDGTEYDVIEIVRDDTNDIAVLKIEAEGLNPVDLGDSDILAVGQSVIAIGTPLGEYAGTVTSGIISGLDRSVSTSSDWFGVTSKTYENVIQTDAAVNPGNSGGPLINSAGEVIGINFATTSGADNISFALPINKVKERVEEYITYGKFIKPYLGVSYQIISAYQALYYNNVVAGALVADIDPLGPAYEAGIRRGDIITYFDDAEVENSLSSMIQSKKVGDEVKVKVWRDGDNQEFTVILTEAD
jgi:serine protease Do